MKTTLVIFQCCKKKADVELYTDEDFDLHARIPRTKEILVSSTKKFALSGVIDVGSRPVTALSRYDGHFYKTPGLRSRVAEEIKQGPVQFLIMSAGYGFVHPFQRIQRYDQRMTGKITRYWLHIGLPKVLEEFLETGRYRRVFGFFSKSADYRRIFEEVNWQRLTGLEEVGYFCIEGLRGPGKILRSAAMLMIELLGENFKEKPQSFAGLEAIFIQII